MSDVPAILPVLPYWLCDQCHEPIHAVGEGWVEWLVPVLEETTPLLPPRQAQGLRLVHHLRCMYDASAEFERGFLTQDGHLTAYLGSDGLMQWLAFLGEERFHDSSEVLEMMKRLFIPGYEVARLLMAGAMDANAVDPGATPAYPDSAIIELVLQWGSETGRLPWDAPEA